MMQQTDQPRYVIAGGGLGGALMAVYLGRAGYRVDLFEMRGDLRSAKIAAGKSINLALSHRGICALEKVGLADKVLASAVPMPGRLIHALGGGLSFQPYGKSPEQAINSVSRGDLNCILLEEAEAFKTVRLHFHQKCTGVDLDTGSVSFMGTRDGDCTTIDGAIVVGADGAFSAIRHSMQRLNRFDFRQDYLKHGYKELTIPARADGGFALEKNALHIWPRRSLMMIALPNADATFTCTLFWPFDGPDSFATIDTGDKVRAFFEAQFPDAVSVMPNLVDDYLTNPVGSLVTTRCAPWYHQDKIVMLGDACHAVVPFYGQGMNAAFEDVLVLSECLEQHRPDWKKAFAAYHEKRKNNVDALADLAISNFVEMRDHTGSRAFLRGKQREKRLHKLFPRWYIPLYTMVTFSRMPYREAVNRAARQDRIVRRIGQAIWTVVLLGILALAWGLS